jgi:hypothetical protein
MAGIGTVKKFVMVEQHLGQLAPSTNWLDPILTLPAMNGRGFFLHPARLPVFARRGRVEVVCPEAFPTGVEVPVCPTVPNAFLYS